MTTNMVKLTKAEIERAIFRAAEQANKEYGQWMPQAWIHALVRAYGTAAAEAGNKKKTYVSTRQNPLTGLPDTYEISDNELVSVTAAAEAGEHDAIHEIQRRALIKCEEIEASTIERCAQVAESYGGDGANGHIIAAAIRTMKEGP